MPYISWYQLHVVTQYFIKNTMPYLSWYPFEIVEQRFPSKVVVFS